MTTNARRNRIRRFALYAGISIIVVRLLWPTSHGPGIDAFRDATHVKCRMKYVANGPDLPYARVETDATPVNCAGIREWFSTIDAVSLDENAWTIRSSSDVIVFELYRDQTAQGALVMYHTRDGIAHVYRRAAAQKRFEAAWKVTIDTADIARLCSLLKQDGVDCDWLRRADERVARKQ